MDDFIYGDYGLNLLFEVMIDRVYFVGRFGLGLCRVMGLGEGAPMGINRTCKFCDSSVIKIIIIYWGIFFY